MSTTQLDTLFKQIEEDRREHMKDKSYLYLEAIGVSPKFQGQGFGGKLLKFMLRFAVKSLNEVSRGILPRFAAEANASPI